MKVKELIEHLEKFDGDLPVVFHQYSDFTELEAEMIYQEKLQKPRGDGYVGHERPDKASQQYLCISRALKCD